MTPSTNVQSRLQEANNLLNAGKYERAGEIYFQLINNKEVTHLVHYQLAKISNITNDPVTAKNLYYKAFELKSDICSFALPKEHPNHRYVYKGQKNEEKVENCPLCGKSDCSPRWCYCVMEMGSTHVQSYNPVRLWMYCEDCHHMYAEEFPSQEAAASSAMQVVGDAMTTNPAFFKYNSEILSRLTSLTQGNELLEIGVGGSECALVAGEMGFNVQALDVSEGNVRQAIKYGIDAKVQDIIVV